MSTEPEFDAIAKSYDEALSESLSLTGEGPAFYAERRVAVTRRLISQKDFKIERILDFGCGIGTAIPFLNVAFSPIELVGVDVSTEMLAEARVRVVLNNVYFQSVEQALPHNCIDLAYCNGVFHHIAHSERRDACRIVFDALRPGGYFALWENNPLNPGTRLLMAKCRFDRTANVIFPVQAKEMLQDSGFHVEEITSSFFFPRVLAALRRVEPFLGWTLLGGQYLILGRK
jgi:SAM-dependent methyltransferase